MIPQVVGHQIIGQISGFLSSGWKGVPGVGYFFVANRFGEPPAPCENWIERKEVGQVGPNEKPTGVKLGRPWPYPLVI